MNIVLVALGGGLGAVARYLLGVWIKEHTKQRSIPTAMLYVNILGSLGLGVFFALGYRSIPFLESGIYDEWAFLFIGLGFFGAFTTFSTFSVEAITLAQKKKWKPLILYITYSIVGSTLAFIIGLYLFIWLC
ncbi:fluoride efflux transporter CrcB [Bacillus shivajii]|uniref:fluoride efflux transporter CrcB n=1 Tax=Bacillus shivajii TaxID=1983719 RepID=UPI001CFC2A89|nr:fluoride efflux transporter CrcB [Bacillus shivajii]UCZ53647.1 fluoride efflux transporter CrcB [Bacillus shivajii]